MDDVSAETFSKSLIHSHPPWPLSILNRHQENHHSLCLTLKEELRKENKPLENLEESHYHHMEYVECEVKRFDTDLHYTFVKFVLHNGEIKLDFALI